MSDPGHAASFASRALILVQQRNYDQALAFAQQAVAAGPEDVTALYALALCQAHIPAQHRKALETVGRALAADPGAVHLHALKASILTGLDKYSQALKAAEAALALDPDYAPGYVEKARALMGTNRWAEAEEALRTALEMDPDDQTAGNLLAAVMRFQNKGQETSDQIDGLLRKDPGDAFSHANAGWAALQAGDLEKAKMHFLEALRIEPGLEYARQGVLETFKAKSPLYRLYLQYCFAMSRLQPKHQIMIIIGLLILARVLRSVLTGRLAILGTIVGIAYLVFVLWSWVARGVGNLFVMLDGFARHALNRAEKTEAFLVGGNVMAGLLLFGTGLVFRQPIFSMFGAAMVASAFPFSIAFTNDNKRGRILYRSAGAAILLLSFLAVPAAAVSSTLPSTFLSVASGIAIVSIWLGAFGFMRR